MIYRGYNRRQFWNCLYWYHMCIPEAIELFLNGASHHDMNLKEWKRVAIKCFKERNSASAYDTLYSVGCSSNFKVDPYKRLKELKARR